MTGPGTQCQLRAVFPLHADLVDIDIVPAEAEHGTRLVESLLVEAGQRHLDPEAVLARRVVGELGHHPHLQAADRRRQPGGDCVLTVERTAAKEKLTGNMPRQHLIPQR